MYDTLEFLKKLNLSYDDYIIVGCSGGPDSMCLLNILIEKSYKIVVAHVNHNLRKESSKEYKFVEKYCKNNNVVFEGLEIPPYDNKNEFFYRKKRYEFYKTIAKKYNAQALMTAHHGDDLMETILMRLTRGSILKGYIGFKKDYYEYDLRIIKPLVFTNKDEILEYCEEKNIPYVIDKTNEEDNYTRNRYRHHILPFLKKESKNVHLKFLQYSEELSEACDYIDRSIECAIKENYNKGCINLKEFDKLDIFIKRKELEFILKNIYKDDIDKIKKKHIESLLENLSKNKNFKLSYPLNIIVEREYDKLYFKVDNKETEEYEYILEDTVSTPLGDITKLEYSDDTSNYTIRLNSNDIKLPIIIRTKKIEDRIEIKNMKGSKKIKNIFIDEKISKEKRSIYPIVTDSDNNILWIPGLKKSKFDNEINKKYDIILKYAKKGDINEEKTIQ